MSVSRNQRGWWWWWCWRLGLPDLYGHRMREDHGSLWDWSSLQYYFPDLCRFFSSVVCGLDFQSYLSRCFVVAGPDIGPEDIRGRANILEIEHGALVVSFKTKGMERLFMVLWDCLILYATIWTRWEESRSAGMPARVYLSISILMLRLLVTLLLLSMYF